MIETPAEILTHYATKEASESFIAWRKARKCPLTETGALRLAKTLAVIAAQGGDPSDALGMAEEHGWQTIKAEWYFKQVKAEGGAPPVPRKAPDRLAVWADCVRSGKDYLCRNIPSTAAREMVERGLVTPSQCLAAGVVL
ncbi:MAG: hypothetical protein ACRC14_18910 [Paracoccaceae bacterium]